MRVIGSPVDTDHDLTNESTIYNNTPDTGNPRLVQADIVLGNGTKDLDGTGGDFTLKIEIGGVIFDGATQTKSISPTTRTRFQSIPVLVPANTALTVKITSPNAADTDVSTTVTLYDVAPLQPSVIGQEQVVQTGDSFPRIGEPTTTSISQDLVTLQAVLLAQLAAIDTALESHIEVASQTQTLEGLAGAPKKTVTDEGSVEERDLREIIAYERYQAELLAPETPLHGLRISRCKPAGP